MRSRSYNRFKQFESRSRRSGVAQLDDMLTLGDASGLEASNGRGGALTMNEFNVIHVQQDVAINRSSSAKAEPRSVLSFAASVRASGG